MTRRADLLEKPQPFDDVELARIAVGINRLTLDVLHDEIRPAVFGCATIEEPGDVGVVQAGQYLPLAAEPLDYRVCVQAAFDEFDRDLFLKRLVGADGQVNGAHPAVSDLADHAVGTNVPACEGLILFEQPDAVLERRRLGEASFL